MNKALTLLLALGLTMAAGATEPAISSHGNFISVTDFGAVPDDGKDDVRAIQNALDYSRDNGLPIVYFPKGVYAFGTQLFDLDNSGVSSSIHVYSGQTLLFEDGAVIRRTSAEVTHILYTHNEVDAVGYIGCHDITIIGATVDENLALNADRCTSFNLSHGERISIIGCEFYGALNWHSIEINSSRDVLVDKCIFRDNRNSEDIQIDAAYGQGNIGKNDGTVCQDITISGCRFKTDEHYAIGNHADYPHHDILIKDNVFSGSGNGGEYLRWVPLTHSVTLSGNRFE